MKISYFYIYLIVLSFSSTCFAYTQSNLADQDFLDNADQFSNENGVKIYSDEGSQSNQIDQSIPSSPDFDSSFDGYKDPNEVPVVKKINDSNKVSDVVKKKQANIGFSFSHMANKSKKKVVVPKINEKKVGFSFFQMAENSKKITTGNRQIND